MKTAREIVADLNNLQTESRVPVLTRKDAAPAGVAEAKGKSAWGKLSGKADIGGTLEVRDDGGVELNLTKLSGLDIDKLHGTGSAGAEMASALAFLLEGMVVLSVGSYGGGKINLILGEK